MSVTVMARRKKPTKKTPSLAFEMERVRLNSASHGGEVGAVGLQQMASEGGNGGE